MRYYKKIENGYIMAIGTGGGGTEITAAEYDQILVVIQSKPQGTDTMDYRLKADLTWEQIEIEPPVPDDDPPENMEEAAGYMLEHEMVELPAADPDPDYLNEREEDPQYFD